MSNTNTEVLVEGQLAIATVSQSGTIIAPTDADKKRISTEVLVEDSEGNKQLATAVYNLGGSGGGGTAATTSFEPTATISSTNVQDAVEEVDAKIENLHTGNVEILTKDEYDTGNKSESKLYAVKKFS